MDAWRVACPVRYFGFDLSAAFSIACPPAFTSLPTPATVLQPAIAATSPAISEHQSQSSCHAAPAR